MGQTMSLFFPGQDQATDSDGRVLSGAKWWFYLTGSTTPTPVYNAAGVSLGPTVTADAGGWFAPIYLDDGVDYRAIQKTAAGAIIGGKDLDPVNGAEGGASIALLQAEIDALDTRVDALEAGTTSAISRVTPRPLKWAAPTGMNNPLKVWVDCDGKTFAFNKDVYKATDWSETATGITHYYLDYVNGNDANTGLAPGAGFAWKTFDHFVATCIDKSWLHCMDRTVGYLSATAGSPAFTTKRIKITGDHVDGPTLFSSWRETHDLAFMAWAADGSAFKSTAAFTGANLEAMLDGSYNDRFGLPLAMPHVADLATVKTTPGSWNWDGTTLSVRMIDDRTPDPADGWIPVTVLSNFNVTTDANFTVENCSFAYNGGAAAQSPFRFRPATTGAANTIRLALKNVRAFGGSANAFEIYDCLIVATQQCYGANCYYDIFNYASFITTGTQAQWMTVYEDNCFGHDAGYSWRQNPTASNSNNLTTGHRGMHVWRVNTAGYNVPNSWLGEVQGCYSMNFGISPTQSQAGTLFQNNYWSQKLAGEGSTGSKMVLIGCTGDAIALNKYHFSNWDDTDTVASLGEIHISDWLGALPLKSRTGTILKNYETGVAL